MAMNPPTISSVADLAGVSIATVSRCLNDPERVRAGTRDRVMKAIKKLDYSPNTLAQSFRRGRTNVVMVVMPTVGCPFLSEVLVGVRDGIGDKFSIVIAEADLKHRSYEEVGAMLVSRQVDGLILLATLLPFGTRLEDIGRDRRLPIVLGCESISHELEGLPSVHIDNYLAAFEATRHLIDLGHQRIGFISGPRDSLLTQDRERGFRAAMNSAELEVQERFVRSAEVTTDGGAAGASALLRLKERPTAVFCSSDEMALGALHILQRAGLRVPEDISVMGFDDTRYAAIASPPLSTVAQPAHDIGRRVAERMIRAIDGGEDKESLVDILRHKLVIRQSTGPCLERRSSSTSVGDAERVSVAMR